MVADINNDGWPDIHISNDYITNDILYINNQDGTFSNNVASLLRHQSQFSMGADIADFNNDAMPDILTLDMLGEDNYRKKTTISSNSYQVYVNNEQWGYEYQYVRNMLHMNNGKDLPFSEIGMMAGIYQTDWSWSPLFMDVDNDGFRDLLVTNGFPRDITDKDFANYRADVGSVASLRQLLDSIPIVKIPNYAFRNKGDLTFEDKGAAWGLNKPSFSNGAVFVDLDGDGGLDYVVNNIDDHAFVFKNTLNDSENSLNYLRINLIGPKLNSQGLGAKVFVELSDGRQLYQEQQVARGYMSSVEQINHFGLGDAEKALSVQVLWPDGKESLVTDVLPNQKIDINYSDATAGENRVAIRKEKEITHLFKEVSSSLGIDYTHREHDAVDFYVQRIIPHKLTQFGPSLAVGDVNGDGTEDLIVGSSAGFSPTLFLQNDSGNFTQRALLPEGTESFEEMGVLLVDLDNDGDLDLYLVGGSNQFAADSKEYQDRIYINDGSGNFSLDESFESVKASGSVVRGADFNGDGFTDLFIGGRSPYAQYPMAEKSFLMKNVNGKLLDVTDDIAPELRNVGMVTDAIWADVDADGQVDLVVVGELMAVTVFKNEQGRLTKLSDTGLENYLGWWNSIVAADFDLDGDTDFIVGNLGENNPNHSTEERPVKVYAKDFDNNGSVDPVTFVYYKDREGMYNSYPSHFWGDLNGQSPLFRRKFSRYSYYANSTEADFFTEEEKKDALILSGNYDKTAYLENLGNGKFEIKRLPTLAQIAPVNGMVADDFNGDGFVDVLMVGNDYGNETFIGRLDAHLGLLLLGDGAGGFTAVSPAESGFVVPGDAKALVKLSTKNGKPIFIASQNRDDLLVFELEQQESPKIVEVEASIMVLIFTHKNGKIQRVETSFGAGFLSQSSRKVRVPQTVDKIEAIDYKGNRKALAF